MEQLVQYLKGKFMEVKRINEKVSSVVGVGMKRKTGCLPNNTMVPDKLSDVRTKWTRWKHHLTKLTDAEKYS